MQSSKLPTQSRTSEKTPLGSKNAMEFQAQIEDYDLVILGSGAGSKLLAWTFAGSGKRVAVVERKYIGGSCPNIACLPSKNVIHTAKIVSNARHSGVFR